MIDPENPAFLTRPILRQNRRRPCVGRGVVDDDLFPLLEALAHQRGADRFNRDLLDQLLLRGREVSNATRSIAAPAEWSARHSAESDRYRPGMHKALGLNRSRIPVTFVEYRKRVVESARGLATKPGSTRASQSVAGPHERRRSMRVETSGTPRDGMHSVVTAEYRKPRRAKPS